MQPDQPLSESEQDELDDFLKARAPDPDTLDPETEASSQPIVSLTELDGFLTAVVCGPETLMPSTWLPVIFGGEMPAFEDRDQADHLMQLIMRHMNEISGLLMERPEKYAPLIITVDDEQGDPHFEARPWCAGFLRGVSLNPEAWEEVLGEPEDIDHPLGVIWFLGTNGVAEMPEDEEGGPLEVQDKLAEGLAEPVLEMHRIFLEQRQQAPMGPAAEGNPGRAGDALRREGPRVGRNDPCPCGSGRKYKKCCLQ